MVVNGSVQTGNTTTVSTTDKELSIPYSGNRPAVGPNGTAQPVVELAGNTTPGQSQGIMGVFENDTNTSVTLRGDRITGPMNGSARVLLQGHETTGTQQSVTGVASDDDDDTLVAPDGNIWPGGPANGSPRLSVTGTQTEGDNTTVFGDDNKSVTISGNQQPLGVAESTPSVTLIGQQETTEGVLSKSGVESGDSYSLDISSTQSDSEAQLTLTGEEYTRFDSQSGQLADGESEPITVDGNAAPTNATLTMSHTGDFRTSTSTVGTYSDYYIRL
jgi:hypothetical protein